MTADPSSLRIVHYPDPALREKAAPIDPLTGEHRTIAARMVELMYEAEGIGLAAPQVGLPLRMFVLDVPPPPERRRRHRRPARGSPRGCRDRQRRPHRLH